MPNYHRVARRIAGRYDIPYQLFWALINQESGWNKKAQSPAGAIGFTQLMPGTAQGLGVNPWNPRANLRGGARYLAQQYDRFGDWRLALSAYNSGPGGSESRGKVEGFPETRNYVNSIMQAYGGANNTGNVNIPGMSAQGSFWAPNPKSIASAQRKQAALSMLGGTSFPNLQGGSEGMNPVLLGAVSQSINKNIANKKFSFNVSNPDAIPAGGENLPGGITGAMLMRAIIRVAQRRGFMVGENPFVGPVGGSHVPGSFHYQTFKDNPNTRFNEGRVGRAVDINWAGRDEASHLLSLFRLLRRSYGFGPFQEELLPGRTYFAGGGLSHSTYPGHYDHYHIAV